MSEDQANVDASPFWNTPELIEELLPFLDPDSTKCLAEAHDLTARTPALEQGGIGGGDREGIKRAKSEGSG